MRNKLISILLVGALALSIAGCSKTEQSKKDLTIKDVANSKTQEEADKKIEAIKEQQKNDKADILLADTENVTIKCKGKGKSAFGGIYITLEVVNKTDKDILVAVDKCSNNGAMVNATYGQTITAKLKSESDLNVMDNSITEVKDFKGVFKIYEDASGKPIEGNIDFNIK